jgi:hypothetical protein
VRFFAQSAGKLITKIGIFGGWTARACRGRSGRKDKAKIQTWSRYKFND